jgi:hypothetical protein
VKKQPILSKDYKSALLMYGRRTQRAASENQQKSFEG